MRQTVGAGLAFVTCVAVVAPVAAADFQEAWPGLLDRIERAYVQGDSADMTAVRTALKDLLATDLSGGERSIARYTIAYLDWRLFTLRQGLPDDERDALLEEAVELLTEDIADNEENAESHALLASVYGMQIGSSAWRGMILGMRASRSSARALDLEPANPRILLLDGVGKLHTPAMFGGGEEKAEALLQRAVAAFQTEPADRPWPRWGLIDAYAWLGQIMVRRADHRAARRYYMDALDIEPEFRWVRGVLLPALEESAR